jgi:hypothetical protein
VGKGKELNMQIDRFTKTLLLAIIVLLTILVVKPVFQASIIYGGKGIEYRVIALPDADLGEWEKVLNQLGKDGWELIGFPMSNMPHIAVLKR